MSRWASCVIAGADIEWVVIQVKGRKITQDQIRADEREPSGLVGFFLQ